MKSDWILDEIRAKKIDDLRMDIIKNTRYIPIRIPEGKNEMIKIIGNCIVPEVIEDDMADDSVYGSGYLKGLQEGLELLKEYLSKKANNARLDQEINKKISEIADLEQILKVLQEQIEVLDLEIQENVTEMLKIENKLNNMLP